MPRLDTFTLEITTGKRPGPEKLGFNINGFPLDFDDVEGGTGRGETLNATGSPQSFPHGLALVGPTQGCEPWDIESVTVTYNCGGMDAYTVHLGAVTLDDESNLDIWHEPPLPTFDV